MEGVERSFEIARAARELPGVVLTAHSASGNFRYSKAIGPHTLNSSISDNISPDAVFWIASCTKLITTVAALQCVERGLFSLDEDVTRILPEFRYKDILTGISQNGKSILTKSTKPITLRHHLSHSSGISYDHFNPLLAKYRELQGRSIALTRSGSVVEAYDYPLLFELGTSWDYGAGVDWAGVMVERANNISLEEYMRQNIWSRLNMTSTTFRINDRLDLRARMPAMSRREGGIHSLFGTSPNPDGEVVYTDAPVWHENRDGDCGGAGLHSNAHDFQKVLDSLCANDTVFLKADTVDMMFRPQLSDASKSALAKAPLIPEVNNVLGGGLPQGHEMSWGLGGLLNLIDLPTGRAKGSLCWFGLPNLTWWIDRYKGISGAYMSALIPPGDPKSNKYFAIFESAIYGRLERSGKMRDSS
ncbi:beta-lactamase/transpeptidase-like protein [Xylogone sp. PMI_703]|nr:beta-lactamase/transpeptidase-like protein [Xylogone sp. PMI_703]